MKCKHVTRSVLAFKLYKMVYNFDIRALIKVIINKALKIELLLIVCTNSKSLYKYLIKLRIIQEKWLIIDIICFH
jgi:hypothetical protein